MKNISLVLLISVVLISCKTKKNVAQNLPKDISEKPAYISSTEKEREEMDALSKEIDSLINSETCSNSADWRISPMGSKPCGGPATYIAYPIKLENLIIPKIQEYTRRSSNFNRKRGLVSDCAIVPPPSGIRCENGKAVLIKGTGTSLEAL